MRTMLTAFICAALLSGPVQGEILSISTALRAALNDNEVQGSQASAQFLKSGAPGGIPMIDDIELRFRNEAFDIKRMRYNLRIQPKGLGETKAADRYDELFSSGYEKRAVLARNLALRNRYLQILDQMEQQALEDQYKELIVVYEDMIKVMEKKKFNVDQFDLNDLIDGEDKNTRIHNELYEIKRFFFPSRYAIGRSLGDTAPVRFDTIGFVAIDSVIARVENRVFSFDTNNVYMDHYRMQHEVAVARYNLEKAEQRQYISLLGFSYDNGEMVDEISRRNDGKTYNYNNRYALELGFRIPDLTIARHDLARRKADYLAEKEDYNKAKFELIAQMEKDKEDLLSFIGQYRFLKNRENQVDANSSLKKYLQMTGVDPLVLLSIKESIVKNHLEIAKLKYRILRNYIQVLDVAGELSRKPLRNFLSGNLGVLE